MRIAVTVESGEGSQDLLVDCDDATTVEELEQALEEQQGRRVSLPGSKREPAARTLVNGARLGRRDRRRTADPSTWQLHVVSGPDAGGVWDLTNGDHIIGRSGGICWNDPSMSRRHAVLDVTATGVGVTDLRSRHGTALDHTVVAPDERLPLPVGATLEIGHSVAVLRETPAVDGLWDLAAPGWRRLLRPPRLSPHVDVPVIAMPEPPRPPEKRRLWSVAVAVPVAVPLAVGVGIAVVLRRPEYLLFALASPVMVLASHLAARVGAARRFAALSAAHAEEVEEAGRQLAIAVGAEQRELREQQPDAAATLLMAVLPRRRLWERRRGDPDFLRLRLGSADQPSHVRVSGGSSDRVARLVPQCVDLASVSVLGIVGGDSVTDGILRWQIAQLAVHQAPRDLSLVFLGLRAGEDWAWLPWLPHLRAEHGAATATDPDSVRAEVSALRELIRCRRDRDPAARTEPDFAAVVVVVRGYGEVSRLVGLRDIVEEGPGVGVHLLCTARVDSELPEQAQAVLSADSPQAAWGSLARAGQPVAAIRIEQVSTRWAECLARGLAPLEDASQSRRSDIADDVHLLDLLDCEPEPGEIAARWRSRPGSTQVVLGATGDGPLELDLKGDGPHALIAGMTGSGKTALLQTLITSLAIVNHPQWLNFVLIDYKGDSAFQECARLPHTVGKVTDLDDALVQRALTSLRAELDRRKAILAEAAVRDVDEYHRCVLREPARPPLPRLVLVIDEFAELAKELPDFVDGLVTIAQLGRSLGVHLVLATQRPSGVLSPAIRANTNIRIALRVADAADSTDVVGTTDASVIAVNRPGRGYLRLGAQGATRFQAARILGPRVSRRQTPGPVVTPLRWREASTPAPSPAEGADSLAGVVDCLRAAAEIEGVAPQRRPWLDALPAILPWSCRDFVPVPRRLQLPFGRSDLPACQRQETACFDLDRDGHLYFVGGPRSGRSEALRTLAAAISEVTSPDQLHVYGIDGGAGGLDLLAWLPHCGAVVARHETERVGRLLARLTAELERRQVAGAVGAGAGDRSSPRLVLMLDRWEGLAQAFAEVGDHLDAVLRLLREGVGVGIHLVITGDRSLLANTRMSAMTEAKYVLRMPEKADYALAGISPRRISGEMPPGRCFGPGMRETQVFLVDVEPTPRQPGSGPRPFRVDRLPSRISVAEAAALLPARAGHPSPIVGVGGDELTAFAPDVSRSSCFAVVGPPGSGRSSVLAGATESATLTGGEVVVIASARSPLHRLDGHPGVLAVLTCAAVRETVEAALARSSIGSRLLVIDDADDLRASPIDPYLLAVASGQVRGLFLLVAGSAEGLRYGFSGWRAELRRANHGLLLSPRSLGDGELVGARLTRDLVARPIHPGVGLLHTGGPALTPVATLMPGMNCR